MKKKSSKKGFSLLELLVAMAVLSILVIMMTSLFNNSISAFNIGTQRAEMNMAARAALEYIARELSSAVAGEIDGASGKRVAFYLSDTSPDNKADVRCFTLTATNPSLYAMRMFCVRFDSASNILEAYHDKNDKPYSNTPAWGTAGTLISNVVDFKIGVYSNVSDLTNLANGKVSYTFDSTINPQQSLPVCADITLELMASDDFSRYSKLSGTAADDYRDKNARIYSTRVFFNNRHMTVKTLKYEQ
jgi:prepilin-type N-terminal cleavage/methylation domain-containing protein